VRVQAVVGPDGGCEVPGMEPSVLTRDSTVRLDNDIGDAYLVTDPGSGTQTLMADAPSNIANACRALNP